MDNHQDYAIDEFGYPETEYSFREKPDGATDPAGEAGWFLQREREKRGETLEYAGECIGIHPYHIEAIEFGDMTRMPRRLEALEMISAYADYLGFDPEPLVYHYVQFLPKPQVAPRAPRTAAAPQPLSSAKVLRFGRMPKLPALNFRLPDMPGGGGVVASIAGLIMIVAGVTWMMFPTSDQAELAQQETVLADPMPTASTDATAADVKITEEAMPDIQSTQAAEIAPPQQDQPLEDLNGLGAFIEDQLPGDQVLSENTEAPQQKIVATFPEADAAPSRLVLKAKAPVWVRVEDAQGNVVMTQMLMAGDTYAVPDREGLVVIARDGGLLSYLIDGEEKGILGTPGEILVGRSLDLASFKG